MQAQEPLSPKDISQELGRTKPNELTALTMLLSRMLRDGQVTSPERGKYLLPLYKGGEERE